MSSNNNVLLVMDGGRDSDGLGIEQAGGNISENTDGRRSTLALSSAESASTDFLPTTSTTTTATWPIRGLEHVDVEEADTDPVPLIQQIDQREAAKINVASEDASATHPLTQDALELEQIEDDDDTAPRPLHYVEIEEKPKSKIVSIEEALDDVDVEYSDHSASVCEEAVYHLSAAARNPSVSVPVVEAYLVEEESDEGSQSIVYEATPLEPELPWWKQTRTRVLMAIICVLIVIAALALSVGPGVTSLRPSINTTDAIVNDEPSISFSPTKPPTKPSYKCFADRKELKAAVERYIQSGCAVAATLCTGDSDTYGWPIGSWCVDGVTDMSSLFAGLDTFNDDISGWNVGLISLWNQAVHTKAIQHMHIEAHSVLRLATRYLLLTALPPALSLRLQLINMFKDHGVLLTVLSMDGRLDHGVCIKLPT